MSEAETMPETAEQGHDDDDDDNDNDDNLYLISTLSLSSLRRRGGWPGRTVGSSVKILRFCKTERIMFNSCMLGGDDLIRLFQELEHTQPQITMLHYGFLGVETVPVIVQRCLAAGSPFPFLTELSVGFDRSIEALEVFCQIAPYNEKIQALEIQLSQLSGDGGGDGDDNNNNKRVLVALAVILPKMPNLTAITTTSLSSFLSYPHQQQHQQQTTTSSQTSLVVETVPLKFFKALEKHTQLVSFMPELKFSNNYDGLKVAYYLKRNVYGDRFRAISNRKDMVDAVLDLDLDDPIYLTMLYEALRRRDDWLLPSIF